MVVGVLALQGGVEEHLAILDRLGIASRRVRTARDLDGLSGLIIPGGESSVIDKLARAFGLADPLRMSIAQGLPTLATCAGMVYLARELVNPAPGQQTLSLLDIAVRRNAFGSQRESFEAAIAVSLDEEPATGSADRPIILDVSFIRAPEVVELGASVDVIAATDDGRVVGVRQDKIIAVSFHPEENGDARLHQAWLAASGLEGLKG